MSPRWRSVSTAVGVALLFALPLLPEILGSRVLAFRDAQLTHWPWRRVAMAALDSGRVPFVNDAASGAQPLLANPNAVLLYPTVLLERLLPPSSAFNLHYLLHVLWAFLGARLLAVRLGISPASALFAGAAYGFSGMMLSYGTAFFNSCAAAAWMPWCAAAALGVARAQTLREAARAAAATGLAFGLQLLAGEPAISLLTAVLAAFVSVVDLARSSRAARLQRLVVSAAGGAAAAIVAISFAAALLLPLRAIFPLTYRGQHLYSEKAFGAAPFALWRIVEWLFPRFGGDPATLNSGASWMHTPGEQDLVYIWCVSLGVLPLFAVIVAATRRDFWRKTTVALAGAAVTAWLFSLGLLLPFSRALFAVGFLRRLRYPIKFYLLTTLCVALLAGFSADTFRPGRRSRRVALVLGALAAPYLAGLALSGPGGWLEARLSAWVSRGSPSPSDMLGAMRSSVRIDSVVGIATVLLLAVILFSRRPAQPGYALALLCAALALPWGLPLFVSASAKDLDRPPALLPAMRGPGRLYASPDLPAPDLATIEPKRPGLARADRVTRALAEALLPATAEPFGVRYVFDRDPDGSYGWYNRLANEAFTASSPLERSRLLRAFGARWALAGEGEPFPLFRPITGVVIAGRHLVLHGLDDPIPEVRWVSRERRRASLSDALRLVRSPEFDPATEVVLPGRADQDARPAPPDPQATVAISEMSPERAAGVTQSPAAGHVLFARTYFGAWRGTLDGRPARVLVGNARDLAIAVPAGRHAFEFAWDRRPFHRGVILQGGALLVVLVLALATAMKPASS